MLHTTRHWLARFVAVAMIAWAVLQGYVPSTPAPSPINYTAVLKPGLPKKLRSRAAVRVHKPTSSVLCLAQNLYFEAHHEPTEALEAVAATVFNRATAGKWYPSTICGVVYQPFQYSWTLDAWKWTRRPPQEYMNMAQEFLTRRDAIQNAYPVTHFHRYDITPRWAASLVFVGQYGQHKFYETQHF